MAEVNEVAQKQVLPTRGLERLVGDSPIVTVTMAGVDVDCHPDAGNQVTLVNESFYLAHIQPRGHKLTAVRNCLTFRAADEMKLAYLGYFEADIVLSNVTVCN